MSDSVESLSSAFLEGLQQLHLQLSAIQIEQLLRYRRELLAWNTRINLTAITNPEEVLLKHFLDSLSLLNVYDQPNTKLLDIGSGAGFPGIVLKIARPNWLITSLEATGKKITFQSHIIDHLHLDGIETIHVRAEELAHKQAYRAKFDLVTARAVASLPVLLEYCAPYCRMGGQIVLPKKGDLTEELAQGKRAAQKVGAVLKTNEPVNLPGLDDGRRLLVWEQKKVCPSEFPRGGAAMAKKPLGLL